MAVRNANSRQESAMHGSKSASPSNSNQSSQNRSRNCFGIGADLTSSRSSGYVTNNSGGEKLSPKFPSNGKTSSNSLNFDNTSQDKNNFYYSDLSVVGGYIPAAGVGVANLEF